MMLSHPQPIDPNDPKFYATSDGTKRILRVNNVTNRDEGLYKCKVQDKITQGKLYVARESLIPTLHHIAIENP